MGCAGRLEKQGKGGFNPCDKNKNEVLSKEKLYSVVREVFD